MGFLMHLSFSEFIVRSTSITIDLKPSWITLAIIYLTEVLWLNRGKVLRHLALLEGIKDEFFLLMKLNKSVQRNLLNENFGLNFMIYD